MTDNQRAERGVEQPTSGGDTPSQYIDKREHLLTHKQEIFAKNIAKGMNQSEAYRQAYNAENMASATIAVHASKLANTPKIKKRISHLIMEMDKITVHDSAQIREYVVNNLLTMSRAKENGASVRLKALELLGKLKGVEAFGEEQRANKPDILGDEAITTLERRIRQVLLANARQTQPEPQQLQVVSVSDPDTLSPVSPALGEAGGGKA